MDPKKRKPLAVGKGYRVIIPGKWYIFRRLHVLHRIESIYEGETLIIYTFKKKYGAREWIEEMEYENRVQGWRDIWDFHYRTHKAAFYPLITPQNEREYTPKGSKKPRDI